MPDLPDWISRTGSAVSSGLGAALPYALPAALGAGIGALSGQGAGATALGGLAGGLAAKGVQSEAEEKSKDSDAELDLKRQQLSIEAQKADLEIQEGQMKLSDDKEAKEYEKSIKDPYQRALYRSDPKTWAANERWNAAVDTITKDPSWEAKHPGVDASMLKLAGPEGGAKILEASSNGKAVNGFHTMTTTNADGTTTSTSYAYGPIDPKTGVPSVTPVVTVSGVSPKTIPTPDKPMTDAKMQASIKGWVSSNKPPGPIANLASGTGMGESYDDWNERLKTYIGTITPDDATEEQVDKLAKPWLAGGDSAPKAPGTPNAAPNKAPTVVDKTVPPKSPTALNDTRAKAVENDLPATNRKLMQQQVGGDLQDTDKTHWGKTGTVNNVKIYVDTKGKVHVLGMASGSVPTPTATPRPLAAPSGSPTPNLPPPPTAAPTAPPPNPYSRTAVPTPTTLPTS
jgi:hypothetical protein